MDVGLATELALGAHLAGDARDLAREGVELVDHRVDRVGQSLVFALERLAVDLHGHPLREVAPGHRIHDAADLEHRFGQVEDELIDGRLVARPAARRPDRDAVADPALAPDRAADPAKLLGRALVQLDDVVEGLGDGSRDAGLAFRQADTEVAVAQGPERAEKGRAIEPVGLPCGRLVLVDALQAPDRTHLPWALSGANECSLLPPPLTLQSRCCPGRFRHNVA